MFTFKQFSIEQDRCAMKVGTDGVLLGAWAGAGRDDLSPLRILDVGTGSGLVALMMAQRFPNAFVDAVEIDEEAAKQAMENVQKSPFANRVRVTCISVQDYASDYCYDVIVSNPPYFCNSLKNPDNRKAQARHSDVLPYKDLLASARRLLKEDGVMSVILPLGESLKKFSEEAVFHAFITTRQTYIRTSEKKSAKRCLIELSRCPNGVCVKAEQSLVGDGNSRSEWYNNLTKDFYL